MRDKEFNKGPWKQDNVEVEASRVIAGRTNLLLDNHTCNILFQDSQKVLNGLLYSHVDTC